MTERRSPLGGRSYRVALTAIEPWGVVTENGSGPFVGTVMQAHTTDPSSGGYELLVRLDQPLHGNGRAWVYFVAALTYRGAGLSGFETGLHAECALTSLRDERANSATPFADIDYELGVKVLADLVVL